MYQAKFMSVLRVSVTKSPLSRCPLHLTIWNRLQAKFVAILRGIRNQRYLRALHWPVTAIILTDIGGSHFQISLFPVEIRRQSGYLESTGALKATRSQADEGICLW